MNSSKKYKLSWIVLIDPEDGSHAHQSIEQVKEFTSKEEAIEWAKSKLTIEVQECDSSREPLPLLQHKDVSWGFWTPKED